MPIFGPRAASGQKRVDITDRNEVDALIRELRPNAVVHLAGLTGNECAQDPERAVEVNVRAVEKVARASSKYGVTSLLFPSTSAVYGDRYTRPAAEEMQLDIRNAYAETKARAEAVLRDLHREGDGPAAAILRVFNVYGAGLAESLVERLLASSPTRPVSLRSAETFTRDYSSVSEIAKVMEFILDQSAADQIDPFTVNIGSGIPTSNGRLLQILQRHRRVYTSETPGAWSYSCADVTAARRLAIPIPLGLDALVERASVVGD
ncbi:UDP-glucose 4-epimerase [Marisediminicola sp. UYEF4]